jgi:hypothetical protein
VTIEELATQPIFTVSIVLCVFIVAYTLATSIRSLFKLLAKFVTNKSISNVELESIELAGVYHSDLEQLIGWVVSIEKLSTELPGPFEDHSWIRLLEMIDNLELVRKHLNKLLSTSEFETALMLGRYVTGKRTSPPAITLAEGKQIQVIAHWQEDAENLLLRMISRIEDSIRYGTGGNSSPLSEAFVENLSRIKEEILL